jgi:hypothetical protein
VLEQASNMPGTKSLAAPTYTMPGDARDACDASDSADSAASAVSSWAKHHHEERSTLESVRMAAAAAASQVRTVRAPPATSATRSQLHPFWLLPWPAGRSCWAQRPRRPPRLLAPTHYPAFP